MRLVLDSVVLVRGLIGPYSRWGKLLFERDNEYHWIVSPQIVEEYLEVIHRPEIVRKYRAVATRDLYVILKKIDDATLIELGEFPAVCRDPGDDKFLATAMAGDAGFVVSEDNDLLSLVEFKGIRIVTAEMVLRELDLIAQ